MRDLKLKNDALPNLHITATMWSTENSVKISNKTSTNNYLLPLTWNDSIICNFAEKLHLKLLKEMILQLNEEKAVQLLFDVFVELNHRNGKSGLSNSFYGVDQTTLTNTHLIESPKASQCNEDDNKQIVVDLSECYSMTGQSTKHLAISNIVSNLIALQNAQSIVDFSSNLKADSQQVLTLNSHHEPILRQLNNCSDANAKDLKIESKTSKPDQLNEENCMLQTDTTQKPNKFVKHNDVAFYPNIICIVCHKWVCIRNRFTHIESHLRYRPYKCSICDYNNRKEIFVELHIKNTHSGVGKVVFQKDAALQEKAVLLAEQSVENTARLQQLENSGTVIPDSDCSTLSPNNIKNEICSSPIVLHKKSLTPDKTIKALLNSPSNMVQNSTTPSKRKRSFYFKDESSELTSILSKQ